MHLKTDPLLTAVCTVQEVSYFTFVLGVIQVSEGKRLTQNCQMRFWRLQWLVTSFCRRHRGGYSRRAYHCCGCTQWSRTGPRVCLMANGLITYPGALLEFACLALHHPL